MKFFILSTLFPFFLFSLPALAQSEIRVKTKWDTYELKRSGSHFTIDGKKADSTHLKPVLEILSTPATSPCPKDFKTQVLVTPTSPAAGQNEIKINLDKGILQGPKGCLLISGPGLDGFPLHRSWLIGPFQKTLAPKQSLAFSSKELRFKAGLRNGEWIVSPPNPVFNYEFLEQFLSSLKDFKIDRYLHLSGAKGKPRIRLAIDGRATTIYQLSPTTWGMRVPGKPWMMVSSHWSNWGDLGKDLWADSFAGGIRTLLSNESSAEQKKKQLESFGASWSESLKRAYQKCLLTDSNDTEVRLICLEKMRRRPTDHNFRTVMALIERTDDPRLLKEASDFLRIKNPEGPRFSDDTNLQQFKKEWKSWWARSGR